MEIIIKIKKDVEEIIKAVDLLLFFPRFTNISIREMTINVIEKTNRLRGRSQSKLVFIKKLVTDIIVNITALMTTSVIDIGLLITFLFLMFFYY